jgi:hypothetical protein
LGAIRAHKISSPCARTKSGVVGSGCAIVMGGGGSSATSSRRTKQRTSLGIGLSGVVHWHGTLWQGSFTCGGPFSSGVKLIELATKQL